MTDVCIDREKALLAGCQIAADLNRTRRRFSRQDTHGAAVSFGAAYVELERFFLDALFPQDFRDELREMIEAGENERSKP